MSQYQTEARLQTWRALAITADATEHLLYLGRSATQVRTGYAEAFKEVLDDLEQRQVRQISLQRWDGAADVGRWLAQATLTVPGAAGKRRALSVSA